MIFSKKKFCTAIVVVTLALMAAASLLAAPAWAQAPTPDLSITKQGPATVEPGERFFYTIVVTNTGDAEATLVEVTDRLPEGVGFVEPHPAGCTPGPPDAQGRFTVACPVGTLAPDASRTIELTVTAPTDTGVIANRATVDSFETEPENSNIVETTVAPDLVIRKLDDPDPVTREGLLLYTLRVTNQGSRDVNGVVIIDDLPIEVDLVRFESEDFTCQEDAGLVRCTGNLLAGETGTVRILVEPEVAGTMENTAEVRVAGVRTAIDEDTAETLVVGGGTTTGTTGGTTTGTTTGTTGGTIGGTTNAGEGCQNPEVVATFTGTENQITEPFEITGETFRLRFETEPVGQDPFSPTVEADVLDENGEPIGEGFLVFDGEDGSENILAGPGTYSLEIQADEARYDITVEDCVGTTDETTDGTTTGTTDGATTGTTDGTTDGTTTGTIDGGTDGNPVTKPRGDVVDEIITEELPNTGGFVVAARGVVLVGVLFGVIFMALLVVKVRRGRT